MKGKKIKLLTILLCSIGFTSCFKELCYNHPHTADLNIIFKYDYDWYSHNDVNLDPNWDFNPDVLRPSLPEWMSVIPSNLANPNYASPYNLRITGGVLKLPKGDYELLFHSTNSDYVQVKGRGDEARGYTIASSRPTYNEIYPYHKTVSPPDFLFATSYDDLYIAEADASQLKPNSDPLINMTVNCLSRVYTYAFRFEFEEGFQYVVAARGGVSGMAGEVSLVDGYTTTTDTVAYLFDAKMAKTGVEAVVKTFGVPGITFEETGVTRRPVSYVSTSRNESELKLTLDPKVLTEDYRQILSLEVLMKSGKQKWFPFDISEQIRKQPRGGVIVVKGLKISKEEGEGEGPSSGGGGFDASVEDWDENVDVFVPIS